MQKYFDLIVVGSGIMGTFHAYHAARQNKSVLLLEKDNFPVGATVRNFGQVVPSGLSGRWFNYGQRSLELYQELQSKVDLTVRNNGSVYVASDDDEWQLANELYDYYQKTGYDCELLGREKCLEIHPYLRPSYPVGALFFPQELSVDSPVLMQRLLGYCNEQIGITFLNNATVVDCQSANGKATVRLANRQEFEAEKVLICNGHEFRMLYPELFANSGLIVSKLQMMQTIPFPNLSMKGNILTGLTIRRYESFQQMPSYASMATPEHYSDLKKWGIHVLFKQAEDGSVVIGDSHEYADVQHVDDLGFHTTDYVNGLIISEAERIVAFEVDKIRTTWAGFYSQTTDEIYEHDIDDHIRIITGIGGKGMTSTGGYSEENIAKLFA
ncbi:MAG TPA: TIGR03364 family FAD-dependent oxidoreductase [Runella sp.]|nr:TIGR03364 family FAD-dependent oxidoreductase [Runella sp.]HAO51785.1 TIGR03364 family FAD-dependent oxidoreductase [Runella sp.]